MAYASDYRDRDRSVKTGKPANSAEPENPDRNKNRTKSKYRIKTKRRPCDRPFNKTKRGNGLGAGFPSR
jgi:hypothetical protein